MTDALPSQTDILIVGAGPVGMTLHLALAAGGQPSLLIDRRPQQAHCNDPRALALAYGARQLLEQIGAWPHNTATAIETIHVSQKGGFGRTLIAAADYHLPALGYVVRYPDLAATLAARIDSSNVRHGCEITKLIDAGDHLAVTLHRDGSEHGLRTKLLVHAEGTPTGDTDVRTWIYGQHAIVAEVMPAAGGHGHRAWERFTPDGPLALLPLGDAWSVVFTLPPEKADAVMAMNDEAFVAALQEPFGPRLRLAHPGPRHRFPLALSMRIAVVRNREAWIGNGAQTLHPVTGQGFNLGLRDAWQLAEALLDRGPDPASLKAYAAARRLDRTATTAFTDGLVRLFSNDITPLKVARGLGLFALDLCPPARDFVARRMIWGARAWL